MSIEVVHSDCLYCGHRLPDGYSPEHSLCSVCGSDEFSDEAHPVPFNVQQLSQERSDQEKS